MQIRADGWVRAKKRPLTQARCLDSLGLDGGDFFFVFFVFVSPPSEAVRRCEGTLPLRFEFCPSSTGTMRAVAGGLATDSAAGDEDDADAHARVDGGAELGAELAERARATAAPPRWPNCPSVACGEGAVYTVCCATKAACWLKKASEMPFGGVTLSFERCPSFAR